MRRSPILKFHRGSSALRAFELILIFILILILTLALTLTLTLTLILTLFARQSYECSF